LIARTLAAEPLVVLLDEPWEGLDGATARLVAAELGRRMELGLTIVCVSHIGPGGLPLERELSIAGGEVSARALEDHASAGEPGRNPAVRDNGDATGAPRGNSTSARRRAASSRPR
jgi:ABC-type phosphonate transport system ATPase subunit